jgi:hypothetical protein
MRNYALKISMLGKLCRARAKAGCAAGGMPHLRTLPTIASFAAT